jgi:PiT family inorganic phosphate transporter
MSAALALGHGANDAQKSMGVVAVLLLAGGQTETLSVPLWVRLACAASLTVGTAVGGWRVVRTIGRRLFHLRPLDGLASEAASGAVLLTASVAGAAVSTTHVVTASVVGVGGGRRRWRHVRWLVVRSVGSAWLLTLPATAALAALTVPVWEAIA